MSEEMIEEVVSTKPKTEQKEKVVATTTEEGDKPKKTTRRRRTTTKKAVSTPIEEKEGTETTKEAAVPKKRRAKVSKKKVESSDSTQDEPNKKTTVKKATVKRTTRKVAKKVTEVQIKENDEQPKEELKQGELFNNIEAEEKNSDNLEQSTQTSEVEKTVSEKKEEVTKQKNNNNNNNNNKNSNRNNFQKNNRNNRNKKRREERVEEINLDENPEAPRLFLNDFYVLSNDKIREKGLALGMNAENIYDYQRQEIITELLKAHTSKGGVIIASGILEVLPDGYGFLRSSLNSYISGPNDIYVSANIIRHGALKTGDLVEGQIKTPRDSERFYGMHRVLLIDNEDPIKAKKRPNFDDLVPIFPDERLVLETPNDEDVSTKIIDLFCPIGKGQRSLIVAPPRTGKTVLLQKIANSISMNYPEISLIVLLVDERPEEVTDMKEQVKGEVIASTFDEQAVRHVQVAEMAIEKAKRMVEHNKDVVILLDSITRLARAYNQTVPASGKVLSGGVDSNALHKPKRFFGAARNIKGGGSLTIISTALIETGSRMDEVIFEEFKGTGNNEIVLDRRLSDRRIFPSINVKKSGTRRDDLLLSEYEESRIWVVRNVISDMDEVDQTPFLIDKMSKAKNNETFLKSINTAISR